MKKISEHLGEIIVALAGVALIIGVIIFFKAPIGDFFSNIVNKETTIGDEVLDSIEYNGVAVIGKNYVDYDTISFGYYDKNGVLKDSTTYMHTDFIPVSVGSTYQIATYLEPGVVLFDENYEFVESHFYYAGSVSQTNLNKYLTISNENVKYMVINTQLADKAKIYAYKVGADDVSAYTKTIGFVGDSITAGLGEFYDAPGVTTGFSYGRLLGPMLEVNTKNYARSGAKIAGDESISIVNQAISLPTDLDMVVVMGGVNDYHAGTLPFGTISDSTVDSFYGALNVLFTTLSDNFVNKPIVFLTPMETKYNLGGGANPTTGKLLDDYVAAIKEVAALYDNVYIVNTHEWSEGVIDETFYTDAVHPGHEAHEKIANYVYKELKKADLL